MNARDVKIVEDAKKLVEQRELSHVKIGLFDNDGVMRGKYMSREKFFSALDSGSAFCSVVLGWDVKDQIYDNVSYTGWHTGYHDSPIRILIDTCRELPLEDDSILFLAEFAEDAESVCPRAALRSVIDKAKDM
ncbi:MAG: hypothetical protein V3V09_10475, partial [Arenicellales bacterium]